MKLSELLGRDRVLLPMKAGNLRAAVRALARALADEGSLDGDVEGVVRRVAEEDGGEIVRINEAFLLGATETEGVASLTAALGIAASPFRVDVPHREGEATLARGLVLLLTPQRLSTLRVQAIPALVSSLREGDRSRSLLEAGTADEVAGAEWLDEVEVHDRLVVKDALTPLQYRVYPDTPLDEVVDLMVRRGLHAVPVVGQNHEVLGILTSGDALDHLLPRRLSGEGREGGPVLTRDVMSRSVLCVSEDQPLVEAANTMINKDVAQLPVVREGELVGFLTRRTVLRQLFGR